MEFDRKSGILLHPTSLPGKTGIGTLGAEAYEFVDFLIASNQKLWQILPLGPTGYMDSPYSSFSGFAGNPYLISLEKLKDEGILAEKDYANEKFDDNYVDFGRIFNFKFPVLKKAFENYKRSASPKQLSEFEKFALQNEQWLEDYSLFMALKEKFPGTNWGQWDADIKCRKSSVIEKYKKELASQIEFQKFMQYQFSKQWFQVKEYANKNKIQIIGDIPIFCSYDSSDVWANPDIFFFDNERRPLKVAGVPPDYYAATGQLWGNPLYDWNKLKKTNYAWWIERFKATLKLVDIIRLDHFRGFAAYWAVPASEKTAVNGKWEKGPCSDFFAAIEKKLGELPIIAEDLGVITPDVVEIREKSNFPGMKVLQFAFDTKEENDYLPHSYTRNFVVYTGTHDNDTTIGWYQKAEAKDKAYLNEYLNTDGKEIEWVFIRSAWSSVADIAIAPMQDILSLGSEARMNTPGTGAANWRWRFRKDMIKPEIIERLKRFTKIYER